MRINSAIRKVNLDWINDEWLWLISDDPLLEEIPTWTEADILYLYDHVLQKTLQSYVDTRSSIKTKAEIREWILVDDYISPFSFLNCCCNTGLNHETMRGLIFGQRNQNKLMGCLH